MAAFVNSEFEFGGINHLALTCSDMQRTVDFYTNILDMKLVKTLAFNHESGSGQHFFFEVGNGRDAIAFFWFEDAPPPAPGLAQSGRWLKGAPRRSAKIEAYRDKLRAKGLEVTEVVNHSDRPGMAQYLPAEPNEDTFVRSIYFQDPDGITLEFACWGRPLTEADVAHEPKTAADLNSEKQAETLRRVQAAAEAAGLVPHALPS
jgi:catechol 2,3-dioxygenase-like lactoylglutathione lyase family enzyme